MKVIQNLIKKWDCKTTWNN